MASKFLAFLIYLYLQLVFYSAKYTGRFEIRNKQATDALVRKREKTGKGFIIAFWHGRLVLMDKLDQKNNHFVSVMISRHKDGELMSHVCRLFKVNAVRGSSNRPASHAKGAKDRGGRKAFSDALKVLKAGKVLALTPDGPKGPRMRLQEGVTALARMADVSILPVTYSSSFGINLNTWDKFLLPLPFGRIVIIVGEPIAPAQGKQLEAELTRLTQQADIAVGRTPVLPA